MANENKQKSIIVSVYKSIRKLIPETQLKGAVKDYTNKDGLYGIIFRNVDWTKLMSKQQEITKQLQATDWNLSINLSREDDPSSTATGKDRLPLKVSYCYLGKDFREITEVDFEQDIVL